jgi:hypothetical protein
MANFATANFRQSARARLMDEMGLTAAHFRALSILVLAHVGIRTRERLRA